ncbi:MAG: PDZ domain-containing protein, partial [Actinomycetia bacterium]|nr:PDZ domain-containing protein [Actinomycetes bacterium]
MDTPSWEPPPLSGPAPLGPPVRHRPDPTVPLVRTPPTPNTPLTPSVDAPVVAGADPPSLVATTPGWGWRALIAFLAGGLLAASGFVIGELDRSEVSTLESAPAVPIAATQVPVSPTIPPATLPIPEDGQVEAAQLVADVLGPSVVQITTSTGIGSGVIYGDGLILTNHHVIAGANTITVQLSDGRHLSATVIGSDPNVDIAVVSVGEGLGLPVAPLATDEKASVGQTAIAIGSPFSLQQTVTEGIVSAVDRPVPSGEYYTAMIQTDAPINPGNSGGALADRFGRVIGINTAIQTGGVSNSNAGVGFAIPINTAVSVASRIVAGIPIEPGFLGVLGAPSSDGSAGVEVTEVVAGTAAETAGLQVGDRILAIDGAPVSRFDELAGLVVARQPGDQVTLDVVRGEELVAVDA